jgi:predicted RNase H-like HicB family nuclease
METGSDQGKSSTIQTSECARDGDGRRQAESRRSSRDPEFGTETGWSEEQGGSSVTRYMVIIEQGESSWGAHVPDLPGCVAVGETRAEVISLIREAIVFHIDGLKEEGLPVPKPISEGEFVEVEAA